MLLLGFLILWGYFCQWLVSIIFFDATVCLGTFKCLDCWELFWEDEPVPFLICIIFMTVTSRKCLKGSCSTGDLLIWLNKVVIILVIFVNHLPSVNFNPDLEVYWTPFNHGFWWFFGCYLINKECTVQVQGWAYYLSFENQDFLRQIILNNMKYLNQQMKLATNLHLRSINHLILQRCWFWVVLVRFLFFHFTIEIKVLVFSILSLFLF